MNENKAKVLCDNIKNNIKSVVWGNEITIDLLLAAALSGGHILLEDRPGTGKTTLAKAFAKSIDGTYKRVQMTPDLMPTDITGLHIYNQKESAFDLVKGPVFTNILLADEINRATPRTQAALLEVMEERQVTIDGETFVLEPPFMVIATQNAIESLGTYELPEAQVDRFMMKFSMQSLSSGDTLEIVNRLLAGTAIASKTTETTGTTGINDATETFGIQLQPVCTLQQWQEMQSDVRKVMVKDCVREYMVAITNAVNQHHQILNEISTRAVLALVRCAQGYAYMKGQTYVTPDDVRGLVPFVYGHRIVMNEQLDSLQNRQELIQKIVEEVAVPVEDWE